MKFKTEDKSLPANFSPATPQPEFDDMRGMRVYVTRRAETPGVILECRRVRGQVICFVKTKQYSSWLPIEDIEPVLDAPEEDEAPPGLTLG